MSYELPLVAILKGICPRSLAVTAPWGTAMPYVIWQRAGGRSVRSLDKTPVGGLRNGRVSITAWAATPKQAEVLIRQIEDALTASDAIQCTPLDEPLDMYDDGGSDAGIFGMQQSFSIWAHR